MVTNEEKNGWKDKVGRKTACTDFYLQYKIALLSFLTIHYVCTLAVQKSIFTNCPCSNSGNARVLVHM